MVMFLSTKNSVLHLVTPTFFYVEKLALLVTMMCENMKQCMSHLFKMPVFLFLFNLLRKRLLPMIPHASMFYRAISS